MIKCDVRECSHNQHGICSLNEITIESREDGDANPWAHCSNCDAKYYY
jgi:hypothetical protein